MYRRTDLCTDDKRPNRRPIPQLVAGRAEGLRGEKEQRDLTRVPQALLGVHRQRRGPNEDES